MELFTTFMYVFGWPFLNLHYSLAISLPASSDNRMIMQSLHLEMTHHGDAYTIQSFNLSSLSDCIQQLLSLKYFITVIHNMNAIDSEHFHAVERLFHHIVFVTASHSLNFDDCKACLTSIVHLATKLFQFRDDHMSKYRQLRTRIMSTDRHLLPVAIWHY